MTKEQKMYVNDKKNPERTKKMHRPKPKNYETVVRDAEMLAMQKTGRHGLKE